MKRKIAIPVDNDGILDTHFGGCRHITVITTEEDKIVSVDQLIPPPHKPGLLPRWLAERGVTDIIAGGIGQRAIQLCGKCGVNVSVGAPKMHAAELTEMHLRGTLMLDANNCTHDHHHSHH
jgi:predicted Fe-Mo cluster-binding NifX family protein